MIKKATKPKPKVTPKPKSKTPKPKATGSITFEFDSKMSAKINTSISPEFKKYLIKHNVIEKGSENDDLLVTYGLLMLAGEVSDQILRGEANIGEKSPIINDIDEEWT